jgi:adenylosuccinate lyase
MIERYSLPKMSAIWDDQNKFRIMLDIELAVCEAQSKLKLIPASAVRRMRSKAKFNPAQIRKIEEKTQHDIVAFVNNVAQYIGSDAKYLHLGLTSSDLLDTTLDLQLIQASDILIADLQRLIKVLAAKAKKYQETVCIGRTHGVHAEPLTFGLKMCLWYDETKRNLARLAQAKTMISVGKLSGAVGTYSNIDPKVEAYVCKKLGLEPVNIATQVIQRDIYAQYLSTLAVIASSLEKFALEIRHLQRTEVLEVEEPFGQGQKGSSAMPHKRNPIVCERICGLSRILRANALVALENVALWHERDISHSSAERIVFPDACAAVDFMALEMRKVLEGLEVRPDRMLRNLQFGGGVAFSGRVLLALVDSGMPREAAYAIVQAAAMEALQEGGPGFRALMENNEDVRARIGSRLDEVFDPWSGLEHTDLAYERLGLGSPTQA